MDGSTVDAASTDAPKASILVVDDEDTIRHALSRMLAREGVQRGYVQ